MSGKLDRYLNLKELLKSKSVFLLGPRQTGKSTLIRQQLKGVKNYNLLLKDIFSKLNFDPTLIRKELKPEDKLIVIDEIQKIPTLLDEVQYLIEEKDVRFLLTGSSARKLKKYGTNLLGGRARLQSFHPFTYFELQEQFDLEKMANRGMLPSIYFSDDPEADLNSYVALYLQQEIANEGVTRNLPAFSRFLEVAALGNAEQVDFTAISNDAQVKRTTVHEYFQILQDTLVADELPTWKQTVKRKPIATSKYYFFDWGIVKQLQKLGEIKIGSPQFGKAFESFIYQELKAFCSYKKIKELHYWRSTSQHEVNFILNNQIAIEVKAKKNISKSDIDGIIKLSEENLLEKYFVIYLGDSDYQFPKHEHIQIINYKNFLDLLWARKLI